MRAILERFLKDESAGGLLLIAAAALALAAANSPLAPLYDSFVHAPLLGADLLHWINDGLMAVFFLLVGLEIKREMLTGHLAGWGERLLPGIAAVGGMAVPALVYVLCNRGNAAGLRGWAIPSATDIAFALAVLALVGKRVPSSLKTFLAALAILDDLGAVAIIALFYTSGLSGPALALAGLLVAALAGLNRAGVRRLWPYLLVGVVLWIAVSRSGIHPSLAGVALALAIPAGGQGGGDEDSPLQKLEHAISPWVAFAIVPLFGFANAGLSLGGVGAAALAAPLPLGVALGLLVGKPVGVLAALWLAVRLRLAPLPAGASWPHLVGVAQLCGIGFTMSLFIGALAFPNGPALLDQVKLGVLAGSGVSALLGWAMLRWIKGPL